MFRAVLVVVLVAGLAHNGGASLLSSNPLTETLSGVKEVVASGVQAVTNPQAKVIQTIITKFGLLLNTVLKLVQKLLPNIVTDIKNYFVTAAKTIQHNLEHSQITIQEMAQFMGSVDVETHEVVTTDGHILELFRIKGDETKPVVMLHGLIKSAEEFIIRGNGSITKALMDANYDIWLGNYRGNRYSRNHKWLNPDTDRECWDWSFHQWGIYDLPAILDHITNTTGADSVNAVIHTDGNQAFYVMASERPEYIPKVKVLASIGPIAYLRHVEKSIIQPIFDVLPILGPVLQFVGIYELFNDDGVIKKLMKVFCLSGELGYTACTYGVLYSLMGTNPVQIKPDFALTWAPQWPSGTGVQAFLHAAQLNSRQLFAQYDYGEVKNLELYNSTEPPLYDMSKSTWKMLIVQSKNGDPLAPMVDTTQLRKDLTNADITYKEVDKDVWAHMDFIWGEEAPTLVYPLVIDFLNENQ